ncbi:MAG: integrase core domain-containing protein [Roseiarcus sp.]
MGHACGDYIQRLQSRGVALSMSRVGNPTDNAKAESFMKTLKAEEVNGKAYATPEQERRDIGAFIEAVYNTQRLHSALGYKPPVEFEADLDRPATANQKQRPPCHPISRVSAEGCSPIPITPFESNDRAGRASGRWRREGLSQTPGAPQPRRRRAVKRYALLRCATPLRVTARRRRGDWRP